VKTQKAIATVMILAGSILIAAVFRDIAFPAILCMLGLLGLQRRFTWDIRPERRVITSLLLLLLALCFAVHFRYAGLSGRLPNEHAAVGAWATIARYFLASMILISFLGSPQRLPPSLGLFYMATVIAAGQVLLLDDLYMPFRLLELFSVILIVLYAAAGASAREGVGLAGDALPIGDSDRASGRRMFPTFVWHVPRLWVVCGLILCLALNLGWVTSSVLYRHVELLNYVPVWLWHGATSMEQVTDTTAYVGFSASGDLSSILLLKGDQDTTPVLKVASDVSPGYLRAKAFDHYRQSRWLDISRAEAMVPPQSSALSGYLVGRMSLFRLHPRGDARTREMMIRHEYPVRDAMFTPLGVVSVEAPLTMLLRSDDGTVYADRPRANLSYRVTYVDVEDATPPTKDQLRPMRDVPPRLDPRIHELANRIFAGCTTTAEKIAAVTSYFQAHYTYSLGLSVPPGRDKLEYFLLDASSGYCEYFASGAAMLLRLADVPTQYIVGFLVTARDDDGETWVARNMDAHAWVEAWDEQSGQWRIVEATVPEGLATASPVDQAGDGNASGGYFRLAQLANRLYEYGLFGVLAWALQYYGLTAISFLLATTGAGSCWYVYRRMRPARAGPVRHPAAPQLAALRKLLARMDRRARAAGARRRSSETLQAFAHRLRSQDPGDGLLPVIADWYIQYAELRYGRTVPPDRLHRLQQLVHGKQR
jgi:hypothetical protein